MLKKGLHRLECDEGIPKRFLDMAIANLKNIIREDKDIKYKAQAMNKDQLCEEMEKGKVLNYEVIGHDCGRVILRCYLLV